jgi:hypothetical protein
MTGAGRSSSSSATTRRIECSDGSAKYGTSLSVVKVASGTQVFCLITNTRKLFHT